MLLRAAFGFFSRIPVGSKPLPPTLKGIAAWLPVVGLVIGCIVAGVTYAAALVLPPLLAGCVGCAVWVAVTGGLHLDGVSDCGDGLIVETTRERRLEIMKDSRLGTFGGAALFFNLIFKICALSLLAGTSLPYLFLACCLAGMMSRSTVFIAMFCKTARPGGLGEAIREGVKKRHIIPTWIFILALSLMMGIKGMVALGAALLMTLIILRVAKRRLGGVTGDIFGCLIETTEWVVLFSFCLQL